MDKRHLRIVDLGLFSRTGIEKYHSGRMYPPLPYMQDKSMTDFSNNPLYQPSAIPDFASIQPRHISAIAAIIAENRSAVEKLVAEEHHDWDSLMLPLARMENRLAKAFSPIAHLHAVTSTEQWRTAYADALPLIDEYVNDIGQHQGLYRAVRALRDSTVFAQLSRARQKTITDRLKAFRYSGVALPAAARAAFKKNSLRLSTLSTRFANQLLDASNAWSLLLEDDSRLSGVPDTTKSLMADLAQKNGQIGYRVTLDEPVVMVLLSHADDRALRKTLYTAYNARASELSDRGKYDNTPLVREILDLRKQQAELLGFKDYAACSVEDTMAKHKDAVFTFLEELIVKSKPTGKRDIAELRAFAAQELKIADLQPWDFSYVSEKLRQAKYALSQEDLRPYFPITRVIDGLFAVTETLFGVSFRANPNLSVWHQDLRAYDLIDQEGIVQAYFYLDPYARQKKRGGAWMDSAASRFRDGDQLQLPVVYLVCNFTPPIGEKDAYLTHEEVITLFHEFGHGLHHMLTKVEEYGVSGIDGVEWDAIEQPSQFMENFCYDKTCLARMTAHRESGEALPEALYDKLIAAKNDHAALSMLCQLEFALFDFRLHSEAEHGHDPLDVLKRVQDHVAVFPAYPETRFPMQFEHIFAGGYAAGYYSYKWAEVLSADSFAAFLKEGVLNPETGARFREEILAVGGSRASMDSFIAFRGREPSVEALLEQNGIH